MKKANPPVAPVIEVQDLRFSYPDGTEAICGVNLNIHTGDFVGIIGQNGSGKTTLVKHFNGLLKPTSGQVLIDGVDTQDVTIAQLSQDIGYVFQNPDHMICCDTVEKEVAFGNKNVKMPEDEIAQRSQKAMEALGLVERKNEHPLFLSKGERQRVAVASILAMQPKVFIIDEPTTGQDHRQSRQMMEMVKQFHAEGHTVVVISHDMRLIAEYCKRVVVLALGKVLLDDTTEKVFSQPKILKKSFIQPPQITRLAQQLQEYSFPPDIITPEQLYQKFKGQYKSRR
jgi:energy-coupling factor transport system ATP-binding protein